MQQGSMAVKAAYNTQSII